MLSVLYIKSIGNAKIHSTLTLFYSTSDSCAMLTSKIHNLIQEWAMKLGFGPKYFLKCVLTDSVNNSILKKIDLGLNGPDHVTYLEDNYNWLFPANECIILCTVSLPNWGTSCYHIMWLNLSSRFWYRYTVSKSLFMPSSAGNYQL